MARCDLTLLNFLPILGAIFSQMRQYLSTYSLLKLNIMQGVVNLCECQRNSENMEELCLLLQSKEKTWPFPLHFARLALTLQINRGLGLNGSRTYR